MVQSRSAYPWIRAGSRIDPERENGMMNFLSAVRSRGMRGALVLVLVLASAGMALAQGMGNGMGAGMGGGWAMTDPSGLPALKSRLAITPEQEPQWKDYADAVSSAWETRAGMRQSMTEIDQAGPVAMSMADRQSLRDSQRQAMTDLQSRIANARDALAAVLTPDQDAIFEQSLPAAPGPGAGMGMGGMQGGMGSSR